MTKHDPPSYIRWYWLLWSVFLAILLMSWASTAIWFPLLASRIRANLVILYWCVVMPPLLIVHFLEQFRLTDYVQRIHRRRLPAINLAFLAFVFSDEQFGDPLVAIHKSHYKAFLLFNVAVFLALPLLIWISGF